MRRHSIPGTDLSVSTFCCGLGDLFSLPPAQHERVLEAYVTAGGNFFDTAHSYCHWLPGGNGLSEITIGEYVRRHGLSEAVIATKGGHHSAWRYRSIHNDEYLSPGRLRADLDDSLARLECDSIALYYLHRDDPRVPVGEILDFLNCEIARGRIRYIGASNWKLARLMEAHEYARVHGLQSFVISSSLWSLATLKPRPVAELPHPDYATATAEQLQWHARTEFPMAPFTPTAHGFFACAGTESAEYGTPENLARRDRVHLLAAELGATPTRVALAWLINHPFPVFPVIGTKNPDRMVEALAADALRLTAEQMAWLERGP